MTLTGAAEWAASGHVIVISQYRRPRTKCRRLGSIREMTCRGIDTTETAAWRPSRPHRCHASRDGRGRHTGGPPPSPTRHGARCPGPAPLPCPCGLPPPPPPPPLLHNAMRLDQGVLSVRPTGRGGDEGKAKLCVPKMGLSFLVLYSKFPFSRDENFFWFWVGGLVWLGGGGLGKEG